MSNILDKIIQTKIEEIELASSVSSIDDFRHIIEKMTPCRNFYQAIKDRLDKKLPAVIAEIKKASPSKGIIRDNFDPKQIAISYEKGGACCLSVLTDTQYFQGHNDYLKLVKDAVSLPVLRKDFIINPWQLYESRALGADCILLIVAALDDPRLHQLSTLAKQLGLEILTEVHDEDELQRALTTPARLIGINNRNLKTFSTSLETSLQLSKMIPQDKIVISESGIRNSDDLQILNDNGIHTYLIGETLMKHQHPGKQLQTLISKLI
ncbi:MAG: indole-3-glycerol phosphate synthase TrpC [Proteobacteria bacterium]|nr:indole-3-glycerol phosphate synthase TrpC [Pseudomonadota bacterium]